MRCTSPSYSPTTRRSAPHEVGRRQPPPVRVEHRHVELRLGQAPAPEPPPGQALARARPSPGRASEATVTQGRACRRPRRSRAAARSSSAVDDPTTEQDVGSREQIPLRPLAGEVAPRVHRAGRPAGRRRSTTVPGLEASVARLHPARSTRGRLRVAHHVECLVGAGPGLSAWAGRGAVPRSRWLNARRRPAGPDAKDLACATRSTGSAERPGEPSRRVPAVSGLRRRPREHRTARAPGRP